MKIIATNILAVILGLVIGSFINMGIIMISSSIIPHPNGADVTTMEGLKASIHLFQPKHFVFPFLAHAFGTFVGALITAIVASSYKFKLSLLIGIFFLIGGVINTFILPAPSWFITLDLLVAYIPMAWLGWKIIYLKRKQNI
jgi:hypothetical protein